LQKKVAEISKEKKLGKKKDKKNENLKTKLELIPA
jgi:hypothetical protein